MPMQYAAFPMLCTSKPMLCLTKATPDRCVGAQSPYDDSPCKAVTMLFSAIALPHYDLHFLCCTILCITIPLRFTAKIRGSAASAPGQETREPMGLAAAAERREALSRWV